MNMVLTFSERATLLSDSVLIKAFSYRTTGSAEISKFLCDFEGNKSKKIFFKRPFESSQSSGHLMECFLCADVGGGSGVNQAQALPARSS